MTKFQIVILGIFVLCIIAGVAAFATFRGTDTTTQLPEITIWGTFPKETFDQYVTTINNAATQSMKVNYVQETDGTFSQDFVSALAKGKGPDAILITADMLLPHEDKLALIPYTVVSQRNYLDTYIKASSVYLSANGGLAIPFMIDPLVMYWNRDMFDSAGLATYPRYWGEFNQVNSVLTKKDEKGNIRRSAIAMGQFGNIENAREILGTLFMQTGNPVTAAGRDGLIASTLKSSYSVSPEPAIQFFSQFTNPASVVYSWNRSLPSAKSSFLSGTLATYFGFASELSDLRTKNPNINFDAALMPQLKTGGVKSTYGRLYGFSLVRTSANLDAALQVISTLTSAQNLSALSESLTLPSVRRDVIAAGSNNPYVAAFNNAALTANAWLDVDPNTSRALFADMIESIISGKKNMRQAIQDAGDQYDVLLRQVQI